jgi:NADP-dependent 3-hydroxy acid dehydrogenase YdfG
VTHDPKDRPVYLVLGASGGIGSSLSLILAGQKARVVLAARDEGRLGRLAEQTGGDFSVLDATRPGEVEQVAKQRPAGWHRQLRRIGSAQAGSPDER